MDQIALDVLTNFQIDGNVTYCEAYGEGHINQTKLVVTDKKKRYILQRVSEAFTTDVEGLMHNISSVTEHLAKKNDDERASMHLVKTLDGKYWLKDKSGCYRIYEFVEGTICLQAAETPADFYETAVGFGKFQSQLSDFKAENLVEVIKNFHNTVDRYRIFKEVLKKDPLDRAKNIKSEIEFVLSKEEEMSKLQSMRESGILPVRVTHNDTKINNLLLDEKTRKAVCVIDLDTVMPGLSSYDFGDSIRFGAATAKEDELNLDKMTMSLELYETFARGFVGELQGLSKEEIMSFPLGAKTMTMECGVRFLTDYLDGDHYFSIHREGHNLDRARTQFKLVRDMDSKWSEMNSIIEKFI